jgi:hypothetical protein
VEGDRGADGAGRIRNNPELARVGPEVRAGVGEVVLTGIGEVEGKAVFAIAAVDEVVNGGFLTAADGEGLELRIGGHAWIRVDLGIVGLATPSGMLRTGRAERMTVARSEGWAGGTGKDRARRVAMVMAAFVAAIGLGGLIGWKADIPGLRSWTAWTGWEAPGGAVAMLVCGACLWLQVPEVIPPWRRRVALGLSIITGALALMATVSIVKVEGSMISAIESWASRSLIIWSRFQSCSRAASNSAFSERSPISRASPRAFWTRGISTFLRWSSFFLACSYPSGVIGTRSIGCLV